MKSNSITTLPRKL